MKRNILKRNYKYKNIAAAMASMLLVILIISTSCHADTNDKVTPKVDSSSTANSADKKKNEILRLTKNYKYKSMNNKQDLCKGTLAVIDENHPFVGSAENLDTVYSYLFDTNGSQIIYASGSDITANKDLFTQFNKMAVDFKNEKNIANLLISSGYTGTDSADTEGDEEPSAGNYDESASGLTVDVKLYDVSTGTYPDFSTQGDYKWIADNCYKYGFIINDTDNSGRFRYVGKVYAEIMHQENLTLKKFNDFIKKYTFEKPYSFTGEDGNEYLIYYVKSDGKKDTNVPIPQKGKSDYTHEISGNNSDGYVVYVAVTENTQNQTDSSSQADNTDTAEDNYVE